MNQTEKKVKLRVDEENQLMRDFGIIFEGRITPEKWGDYATLFQEIRNIGELTPHAFLDMYPPDDEYVIEKRVKAAELTRNAWRCIEFVDSEFGWREKVEFKAFEPFGSEIIWCFRRRWKPKFNAKPIKRSDCERLEKRRARRLLCTCTRLQRATSTANEGDCGTFSRMLDKVIEHEDIDEDSRKRLTTRRPDRIIGLTPTSSFRQCLPHLQSKYSPLASRNLVYPFIVIEAKTAENREATFGSIQRQTAFVIRTCLRLQQYLQTETGGHHQCLVWSFAIMGEEWRLYAAIPDGPKMQVFDLWHGTVLFPEGALQLVLLIDYLCDWACDIYRESILNCFLHAGLLDSRHSRSGTAASSQVGEGDHTNGRAISLSLRQASVSSGVSSDRVVDSARTTELPELPLLVQAAPSAGGDSSSWRHWGRIEQSTHPWARRATIRHSSRVKLHYLQVQLPVDVPSLEALLEFCFPGVTSKDAAQRLLRTFEDENIAVNISLGVVSPDTDSSVPPCRIRAFAYFRSDLEPIDWYVTRQVVCVLCTEDAIKVLAQIAGLPTPGSWNMTLGASFEFEQFKLAINSVKLIGGAQSAGLAVKGRQLCLRATTSNTGWFAFEWNRFPPQTEGEASGESMCEFILHTFRSQERAIPELLTRNIKISSHLFTATGDANPQKALSPSIAIPSFGIHSILIKKPRSGWPESTQDFCYLVIDENIRLEDDLELGRLMEESKREKGISGLFRNNTTRSKVDSLFVDQWARVLKGELPPDALQT